MKLKAFTLMELVVSMIISSITIAFVMAILVIVIKMHDNYKLRCEEVANLEKLRILLIGDFEKAAEIKVLGNTLTCYLEENDIEYSFSREALIRNVGYKLDTFNFSKLDFKILKVHPQHQLVHEFELSGLKGAKNEQEFRLLLYKNYDAVTKIKLN